MTWFKVDDTLHAHRKARRAGAEAMGLWVVAGSYASSQVSDESGLLAADEVEALALTMGIRQWKRVADKLVTVGLWEATVDEQGGPAYAFHDWEDYRPGGEAELQRRRDRDAERKRKAYQARKLPDASAETPPVSSEISAEKSKEKRERRSENSPHLPDPSRPDQTATAPACAREGGQSAVSAELSRHPSLRLAASEPGFDREVELAAVQAGKTALVAKALTEAADEVTSRGWAGDGPAVRKVVLRFVRYARPEVSPPERPNGRRLMGATPQGGSIAHFKRVSPEDLRASQPEGDIDF